MLTIIVKGTNGCNLACSYCSLGEKKNFIFIDSVKLAESMTFACKYARYQKESHVNFILHGGEPTLVDLHTYDECISRTVCAFPDLKITVSMQTNGFHISNEYIALIKKHDICIGVSIDGSKKVHDSERKTADLLPTYETVTKNIDKMLAQGISVSCLMVLTRNALNESLDYLDFFEDRKLHLKINPLLNYGETEKHPELVLKPGDYASYLIRVYEEIIKKCRSVEVSPLDYIIQAVLNRHMVCECSYNRECNQHFLCIDYKGNIFPCGKFSDLDEFCIGNIGEIKFSEMGSGIIKMLLERRNCHLPVKCRSCQYLQLCNGGCSAEALIDGNLNGTPILCTDNRMLFEYFHGDGLKLLRTTLTKQKEILEARL